MALRCSSRVFGSTCGRTRCGAVITGRSSCPARVGDSKLIRRLVDGDGGMQMPPTGALLPEEIGVLRAWIDQGAEFRNDVAEEAPPRPIDPTPGGA